MVPSLRRLFIRRAPASPLPGSKPGGSITDDFPGDLDDLLDEIARLSAVCRHDHIPERQHELIRLRHLAGARLVLAERAVPAFVEPDAAGLPAAVGMAEIDRSELTPGLLRAAIMRDGCLLVRGLLDDREASRLARTVERAFRAREQVSIGGGCDPGDYRVLGTVEQFPFSAEARAVVELCSGLSIGDAPAPACELLELFRSTGIGSLVETYLGDRPVITAEKTTLRRVDPVPASSWHQDGRGFGLGVHAVNLWMALSPCGESAPGLDIVPRRLHELVPAGTPDTFLPGQVSDGMVATVARDRRAIRPIFNAGDALLFDELLLHSTSFDAEMRKSRLGLECWFFAPGGFPAGYTPIVV